MSSRGLRIVAATVVVVVVLGAAIATALASSRVETDGSATAFEGTPSRRSLSLMPGEERTLTASYRTADLHGAEPSVEVSGWNIPTSRPAIEDCG